MLRITKLTKPGDLAAWLKDTCAEGQDTIALDLEWKVHNGRDDVVYSAAVTGPTPDDCAVFGPELLPELMQTPEGTTFLFHHATSDLKHLAWAAVPLHTKYKYQDTLVLAHLLQENGSHSLGDLVKEHFGDNYKEEFKAKYRLPEDAPKEENDAYNAKDVHYTFRLRERMHDMLQEEAIPSSLVAHVHSLQRSLLETEIAGIAVDTEYLMQKGVEIKTRIEGLLPTMRESVKASVEEIECDMWVIEIEKRKTPKGRAAVKMPSFSFDSAKQLQVLLYDKLGLPEQKNDKTKNVSVDWDSLEKLKDKHPLVAMIQEYRELQKIYGSFIQGTLDRMVDGRVYPSFNCCGTTTGRISHSNPNLGQLPRSGGIRGMYIPDPGYVFVTADYSSLEVYIEAHFTGDKNLLKLIETGMSKHDLTASEVGIDRNTAKTVNFLAQYHGTSYKLSKVLNISREKAQVILDKYWEAYGGCKAFKEFTDKCVNEGTPIIYPSGRRRRFEKKTRKEWDGDYRAAYNSPIQGTGSDCMSWAFYTCSDKFKELGWGRGGWTVHDEGIMQVKKEHAEEAAKVLVDTMVEAGKHYNLNVALKAEPCIMEDRWEDG
jgi:DNA polymerase-1